MAERKPFVILMVDDDDDDWLLVKDAVDDAEFECELEIDLRRLSDGRELVEYLQECNGQEGKPARPDVILLDLNMPGMGGRAALKQIKSSPNHRTIPVVIYSTSEEREDVLECYRCGANTFIKKSESYENLKEVILSLANYWMCTAPLPGS